MKTNLRLVDEPLSTEEQLRIALARQEEIKRELAEVDRTLDTLRQRYAREKGLTFIRIEQIRMELGNG